MRPALRLAVVSVLSCVAGSAPAMQDDKDRSAAESAEQERRDPREELRELGATLKAAVLSGTLTREEAGEIYNAVAVGLFQELKAFRAGNTKEPEKEAEKKVEEESPKRGVMKLSAPKPRQIRALFEPEFLTRDLAILHSDLDLNREQMMIAGLLVRDYLEATALASSPLREAIRRYRGAVRDQWLQTVLERSDQRLGAALQRAERADPEVAIERTRQALESIASESEKKIEADGAEGRAKFDAWTKHMIEVTGQLDARLASVRQRATAQLAELDREGAPITAEDLARLAKQLRGERARLREQMIDDLEIITTEEQRGAANARFEAAMARIRVDHLLPHGRLGGESMNLWAALTETGRGQERGRPQAGQLESVEALLRRRASRIAQKLDGRMEATLDREVEGLEFQAERDRIAAASGASVFEVEERRLTSAWRPFAEAARHEVTASVAVRDALRTLLDEASAYLDEAYPDTGLSDAYREASLRRGFPIEMRGRWSERVMAAALKLDGLDDDTREALLAVETANTIEITALRRDALAKRIARDPKLAREFIEAEFGGEEREVQWHPEMWLGINYEAFDAIDDRTESRLRAILTPEQCEALP
ncbi:MAG: coiled-coil domain-containing protein, partial [Planctomycetota bacterium]